MGHDRVGCDSTMGANPSRYKTWIPHKRPLLCILPTSQRSQAIQVSKLPNPGAVTPPLLHRPAHSAGKQGSSRKEITVIAVGETLGMAPTGVQGGAPRPLPEQYIDSCSTSTAFCAYSLSMCRRTRSRRTWLPPPQPAHTPRGRTTSLPASRRQHPCLPAPPPASLHYTALSRAAESPGVLCNNAKQI